RDVVEAWMESPTHRANIVKPVYEEIGVGVAQGTFQGKPATFVVQYFGAPYESGLASAPPAPLAQAAPAVQAQEASPQASAPEVQGAETQAAPVPEESSPVPEQETPAASAPVSASAPAESVSKPSENPWSSFARELARGDVKPGVGVLWVLGGVAAFLTVALALAFFIHIQVQATDMLVGGAVIAVVAISFLALNIKTPYAEHATYQAAAVFGAVPHSGGFIDSAAASDERH
ncbi:MAG TPA: CAP domain-containing protein, partial [Candidatus Paceibacterota bacterium]|nr:CAP domain-containing protein [Candidatus Paceibacterota bacterium]